jgi:hypothetical protein
MEFDASSNDKNISLINFEHSKSEQKSAIPLIAIITVDNKLYGRFDNLINRFYNGDMNLLQLIYDFNRITDPTEIKLGSIIELPNIDYFNTVYNSDFEDNTKIPGVNSTPNNNIANQILKSNKNKKSNKTIASPKLDIELDKVRYESETGKLIF